MCEGHLLKNQYLFKSYLKFPVKENITPKIVFLSQITHMNLMIVSSISKQMTETSCGFRRAMNLFSSDATDAIA